MQGCDEAPEPPPGWSLSPDKLLADSGTGTVTSRGEARAGVGLGERKRQLKASRCLIFAISL